MALLLLSQHEVRAPQSFAVAESGGTGEVKHVSQVHGVVYLQRWITTLMIQYIN